MEIRIFVLCSIVVDLTCLLSWPEIHGIPYSCQLVCIVADKRGPGVQGVKGLCRVCRGIGAIEGYRMYRGGIGGSSGLQGL